MNSSILKPINSDTKSEFSIKKENKFNDSMKNLLISSSKSSNNLNKSKSNNETKTPFYPPSTHTGKNLKRTIAENNMVPYDSEKSTLFSTWTPLSDDKSNNKVSFLPSNHLIFNLYLNDNFL